MPGEQRSHPESVGACRPKLFDATDTLTPRSRRPRDAPCKANRGRDTGPELAVRSLAASSRLAIPSGHPLPFDRRRRADIVFTRVGLYVFIDGCFWHGCPEHFVTPKTRTDFWLEKIEGNRERDRDTDRSTPSPRAHLPPHLGARPACRGSCIGRPVLQRPPEQRTRSSFARMTRHTPARVEGGTPTLQMLRR